MGRAIVRDPQVFLFDEPLSNLDAKLRVAMRTEIKELHQRLKTTTVYVTHDQIEAMTMADKIVVMHEGIVEQMGTPLELYDKPDNQFVAGFIGSPRMNFIKATASPGEAGRIEVALPGGARISLDGHGARVQTGQAVTLGIRPDHLLAGGKGDAQVASILRHAEYLGSETMFYASLPDGGDISVKADGLAKANSGSALSIGIPAAACHLFDDNGLAILNGDLTR